MKKTTILFILLITTQFTLKSSAKKPTTNPNYLIESFKKQVADKNTYDQCTTIFQVPFHETFNSNSTTTNCWNAFNLNIDNVFWINNSTNTNEGNGSKHLPVQNLSYGSTNDWLVSPNINLDAVAGTKELKFYVKLSPHLHSNWQVDQVIKVAISSNGGSNLANFTTVLLPAKTFQNDFFVEVKVDLIDRTTNLPLTGVINVGFHVNRTTYPLGRGIYLDDVIIDVKPTCKDITNIVTCVNNTSVAINWNPGQNESLWEYCIVPAGQPPLISGNLTSINDIDINGLTTNTWYTIWVRAICGPNLYSNWTPKYFKTIIGAVQANPFCGDSGAIVFQNNYGSDATSGYGPIGCLGFTPNAIWYYFKIDTAGDLEFNIIQNTAFNAAGNQTGTPLDVDYVAFGPFNSLDQACANIEIEFCSTCPSYDQVANPGNVPPNFYPYGNIVDCSPSPSAIETLSIPNAQIGEIYAVLISNWDGLPGYIKLEQTNSNTPGAGSTNCDFLCEINLGEDITVCNGQNVNLIGRIDTIGNGDITSIQWFFNDVLMDVNIYNTLNITVNQSGIYKIIIEKENCTQSSITDEVTVTFTNAFDSNLIPTSYLVCDLEPDGVEKVDFESLTNLFISLQDQPNYDLSYFSSNINAINNNNAINIGDYQIRQNQTIYVRISNSKVANCITIAPIQLVFKIFENPIVNFAYQNPICKSNHSNIAPITPTDFSTGGFFSSSPGLQMNSLTGDINVTDSEPGTYLIKYTFNVSDSNCGESKTFETTIQISREIDIIIQGSCFENKYLLSVLDLSKNSTWTNLSYEWNGNGIKSNEKDLFINKTGNYYVKITTPEGCNQIASINLEDINCSIPKGISPNGDGINDSFVLDNLEIIELKIFNRYGTEVYKFGNHYKDQWMGQDKNGNSLPTGTYFYAIQTTKEILTGWIQIVREIN